MNDMEKLRTFLQKTKTNPTFDFTFTEYFK